jgi:hypothetical protein
VRDAETSNGPSGPAAAGEPESTVHQTVRQLLEQVAQLEHAAACLARQIECELEADHTLGTQEDGREHRPGVDTA